MSHVLFSSVVPPVPLKRYRVVYQAYRARLQRGKPVSQTARHLFVITTHEAATVLMDLFEGYREQCKLTLEGN